MGDSVKIRIVTHQKRALNTRCAASATAATPRIEIKADVPRTTSMLLPNQLVARPRAYAVTTGVKRCGAASKYTGSRFPAESAKPFCTTVRPSSAMLASSEKK